MFVSDSPLVEGLKEPLDCLLVGKWGFTKFEDLPLSGQWSELINTVPIAVNVCILHDCSMKLKEALWTLSTFSPDIVKEGVIDTEVLGDQLISYTGESTFAAVAEGIGLQLNEFASLVGSMALYIAVNSTIIATQIELFEKGKGVCLHKGPLPWPFPVKVGPFLLDVPVIVSSRE